MPNSYLKNLLGDNEQILFVTRQHWLVLVAEILSESILTIALIVLISLVWAIWLLNPLISLAYIIIIFPLISLARDVLIWRNRQYIITTRRVIQISGGFN